MVNENPTKTVMVLFGSPHSNGYTAHLLDDFLKGLPSDYEILLFHTYQHPVAPCTGCGYCEQEDGCPKPDFLEIDTALRTADLLVVATPIYNLSFPAPLKAVFDRMQRYFSARFCRNVRPPIEKHKQAVMLLTCGADCGDGVDIIRRQLNMIFTVINASLDAEIIWKQTDQKPTDHGQQEKIRRVLSEICRN